MSHATLYHGDCLERMRAMPDACVDAIITDPPYCAGSVSESGRSAAKYQGLRQGTAARMGWFVGDNMTTAGLAWLLRMVAFEARRVMRHTGHMLCFMDWRMSPTLLPAIESAGLRYQNLVVWDKGVMGLGCGFRSNHELIGHFTNGSPEYHDASRGNILRHSRVRSGDREHQTQKPVGLMRDLIAVTVPPGGVVLDPFAGSGSTLLAAITSGRDAIGIERDAGFVEIAERRVGEQPSLFPEERPA